MSTSEASTHGTSPSPAQAFGAVLDAAVGAVAAGLERRVATWIDRLDEIAGSGGALQHAGVAGVKAHLQGQSPARAAIRAMWQSGTPAVRAAIATSAVAALVLLLASPALLLVYLLSWLVIAAVSRSRGTGRRVSHA